MSAAVRSISCVSLYGNHCSTIIALCLMCMPGLAFVKVCMPWVQVAAGSLRLPDNRTLQLDQHFSLSMLTASSVLDGTYPSSFPSATSSLRSICCKTGCIFGTKSLTSMRTSFGMTCIRCCHTTYISKHCVYCATFICLLGRSKSGSLQSCSVAAIRMLLRFMHICCNSVPANQYLHCMSRAALTAASVNTSFVLLQALAFYLNHYWSALLLLLKYSSFILQLWLCDLV